MAQLSPPIEQAPTLLSAPIELAGDWGHMVPAQPTKSSSACGTHASMACAFSPTASRRGCASTSTHPGCLPSGCIPTAAAWPGSSSTSASGHWSQLAYQFGHELGHVMANSWQPHAKPTPPCQWIEEALVEAFSIRGLGRLAESWKQDPPFPGDNAFGNAIADYRHNIIQQYTAQADEQGLSRNPAAWFADHRSEIEMPALNRFAQAASLTI